MDKKMWIGMGMIVFFVSLITFLIINASYEVGRLNECKRLRIIPFTDKLFTWEGILELNGKGEYQPRCL